MCAFYSKVFDSSRTFFAHTVRENSTREEKRDDSEKTGERDEALTHQHDMSGTRQVSNEEEN